MKPPRLRMLGSKIRTLDSRTAKPLPKQTDEHYGTRAHKVWAQEVKERAGYQCEVILEDGSRCPKRYPAYQMYAGHIKNKTDYPELATDLRNGRCECNSHNTKAGIQDRERRIK